MVDGADVVELLLELLIGAAEAATLPGVDCSGADAVDDGELFVDPEVAGVAAVDVAVADPEVSVFGADDAASADVVVDAVGLEAGAEAAVVVGALLASVFSWESTSFSFILTLSALVDESVVTVEEEAPVVADDCAPLASSSEPK